MDHSTGPLAFEDRALRDGTPDPLTSDVAGRILSDEQRRVPFHGERLRDFLLSLTDCRSSLGAARVILCY